MDIVEIEGGVSFFFFFNDTATTEIYTLSLHDALPIFGGIESGARILHRNLRPRQRPHASQDRKSTRLNSSHSSISYAVFCLKKKKNEAFTQAGAPGISLWRIVEGMRLERVPLPDFVFFYNDTATTEIYTLSLHDALPISTTSARKPASRAASAAHIAALPPPTTMTSYV